MDADFRAVEHLDPSDVEGVRRAGADRLGEARDPDPHQLALLALLLLFFAKLRVTDHVEGLVQGTLVVSAVIGPAQWGFVRELLRLNEIPSAQFGRVDL